MILADHLSFAIGVFAGVNTVNNDEGVFDIETNTIFPDPESMGSRRKVYQGFSEM